ncbi:AraC family transcriptional regulator [Clostridium beijerinckii]|uniref:AraC family transcriptional regulator n=1 Tax=Clostridium beijerinckii TaxID=1520 RepID=UPI001493FE6E|nr:AraC family transcriptional regulator [Clostridium beijerinckii]NOW06687.1 AraC-like DNA-binding protein [Clostridium beijerinckii]NYC00169.1 AraC-like DNA-binding protein [Clostridium beijerinckii]
MQPMIIKENSHGDITFPLSVYNYRNIVTDCILYCHWHNEVEFWYLIKGDANFFIDGNPVSVKAGEVIFINSNEIHTAHSNDFLNCEYYAVVFDLNMLYSSTIGSSQSEYISPLIHKRYVIPKKITMETKWERYIINQVKKIIREYLKKEGGYEISIISALYSIIYKLISNNKLCINDNVNSKIDSYKLEQFKKAVIYIQSNYNKKIGIADMAHEINISQYYFCRFFKKMSGNTPFEYLIHYRINQAEKLLGDADRKIMDIALDVGFETVSHFIKTFKKIKKCTPSKFREIYIRNYNSAFLLE